MPSKSPSGRKKKLRASNLHTVLPAETFEALKNGHRDPLTVALEMVDNDKRHNRIFKDIQEAHKKKFCLLAAELAKMAFGVTTPDQNRTLTPVIVTLAKEMVDEFFAGYHLLFGESGRLAFISEIHTLTGFGCDDDRAIAASKFQDSLKVFQGEHDRVLSRWSSSIIRATGLGPAHHSQAYRVSFEKFLAISSKFPFLSKPLMSATNGIEFAMVANACIRVAHGDDKLRDVCWECGVAACPALKCTGCDAARYCGPQCQRKSWQDGHKGACKVLKTQYQILETGHKFIRRTLTKGVSSAITPNPHFYAAILEYAIPGVGCTEARATLSHGVFIKRAYAVIQDIANGSSSHFAFTSSHTNKFVSESARQPIQSWESMYAVVAVWYSIVEPYDVETMQSNLKQMHPTGKLMTAERFVDIFKIVWPIDSIFHPLIAWDFYHVHLFKHLREKCHKA